LGRPFKAAPRLIPPRQAPSFMRFSVGSRGMFVSKLAMLMSRSCVVLGFVVLAECVVMLGLMMMLTRWMLRRLCHLNFLLLNWIPPIFNPWRLLKVPLLRLGVPL
jgi:hypothetical protein